jgi:hypothetical protein
MKQSPLEATHRSTGHEFTAFYGTRRLITVLTTAHHWTRSESDGKELYARIWKKTV